MAHRGSHAIRRRGSYRCVRSRTSHRSRFHRRSAGLEGSCGAQRAQGCRSCVRVCDPDTGQDRDARHSLSLNLSPLDSIQYRRLRRAPRSTRCRPPQRTQWRRPCAPNRLLVAGVLPDIVVAHVWPKRAAGASEGAGRCRRGVREASGGGLLSPGRRDNAQPRPSPGRRRRAAGRRIARWSGARARSRRTCALDGRDTRRRTHLGRSAGRRNAPCPIPAQSG